MLLIGSPPKASKEPPRFAVVNLDMDAPFVNLNDLYAENWQVITSSNSTIAPPLNFDSSTFLFAIITINLSFSFS